MPLSEHGGLVSCGLQKFWERLLGSIEVVPIVHEAILVTVLSGDDHCPAWAADGVGAKTLIKKHPLCCQTVDVGGWVGALQPSIICADGVRGMVVTENENDIGLLLGAKGKGRGSKQEEKEYSHDMSGKEGIISSSRRRASDSDPA